MEYNEIIQCFSFHVMGLRTACHLYLSGHSLINLPDLGGYPHITWWKKCITGSI